MNDAGWALLSAGIGAVAVAAQPLIVWLCVRGMRRHQRQLLERIARGDLRS